MSRRLSFLCLAVSLAAGCKTITEELPTASTPSDSNGTVVTVPFPVTVTPITIPQAPAAPSPTSPTGPSSPIPPDEGNGDDGDSFIPDNTNAVARVISKVFFVECGGAPVPGSENASTAPVGCRVHLDTTPKDAGGKPTQSKRDPQWVYSNPGLFTVQGNSAYNPVLAVTKPGSTSAYAVVDGVQSNSISIRFQ
ncbi:MAG TPA: hypothetical protein VI589_16430 [Vicinamibacteria bacterium]